MVRLSAPVVRGVTRWPGQVQPAARKGAQRVQLGRAQLFPLKAACERPFSSAELRARCDATLDTRDRLQACLERDFGGHEGTGALVDGRDAGQREAPHLDEAAAPARRGAS